jgi:hypothetical protein
MFILKNNALHEQVHFFRYWELDNTEAISNIQKNITTILKKSKL